LLTSNDADVSAKRVVGATGRAMGVSGMIVIERLEPDGFGADWLVVGERTLDGNETHSWSPLSSEFRSTRLGSRVTSTSSRALRFRWTSQRRPAGAGATPEPSTWAMILIGFAGLGLAGYRSSRNNQRSVRFPMGYMRDDVQPATKIRTLRLDPGAYPDSLGQRSGKPGWRNEIDGRRA
jgi:PEP-CTERM motif